MKKLSLVMSGLILSLNALTSVARAEIEVFDDVAELNAPGRLGRSPADADVPGQCKCDLNNTVGSKGYAKVRYALEAVILMKGPTLHDINYLDSLFSYGSSNKRDCSDQSAWWNPGLCRPGTVIGTIVGTSRTREEALQKCEMRLAELRSKGVCK